MKKKFSLKKFNSDREKSLERSKKGELELINPRKDKCTISLCIEEIRKKHHPLYEKAESCEHKLALGCDLSKNRRNKPECEACL